MTVELEPPRWHGAAFLLAGVVLGAALVDLDGAGRLLGLPVVGLVLVLGLRDLLLRPVLHATADRLTVVDGLHRREVAWDEVERMRVVKDRRSPLLELDLGTAMVVLGSRRLGLAPEQALDELQELRRLSR